MKIEVEEIKDLMYLIGTEIQREVKRKVKKFKDEHSTEMSEQEHEMDCERSWEEGYDKGYQDAKDELKDEAKKNCKVNEAVIEKICKATENWIINEYSPGLQRWIEEQIMPKCKDELKDLTEKKAISTQMPLEDLTPAPPIDVITQNQINSHFTMIPHYFGHHCLLYKLSEKEYCKAIGFMNKTYYNHKEEDLTYSFETVSDGIGIAITIICDQYPEEREDITDYSRW